MPQKCHAILPKINKHKFSQLDLHIFTHLTHFFLVSFHFGLVFSLGRTPCMPGHISSLANWDGALSSGTSNLKHDLTHTQTIKTDQHTPATSTPRVDPHDIPDSNHKFDTQSHSQSYSQIARVSFSKRK